jgi:hypothetical protein
MAVVLLSPLTEAIDEVVQSDLELPAGTFVMGVCYFILIIQLNPFNTY